MSEFINVDDLVAQWGTGAIIDDYEIQPEWVFEGLIEKSDQWIVSGAPKAGKSRLALQIAIAASEGTEFFGYKCKSKQKVLYIDFELSKRLSAERVVTMYAHDKGRIFSNIHFFRCSDYKSIDILDESTTRTLQAKINALKPDLIIFDVLARMHSEDENSNPDMAKVMLSARQLANDAAHIIVHHARKETHGNGGARSMRGASSIHGEVNGVIALAVEGTKKGSHSVLFSLRGAKDPGKIWLDGSELMFTLAQSPEPADGTEQLTAALRKVFADGEARIAGDLKVALSSVLGVDQRHAARKMKEAVDSKTLLSEKKGRFVWYRLLPMASV